MLEQYSFLPTTPKPSGFDTLQYLQELNGGSMSVPYSPQGGNPGVSAPTWNNPYAWQSWANSDGLGDFLGGNAPLFMGGLQTLSGGLQAYTGLKGLSLAKDAFKQQKKEFNINLNNQTKSYNTQVSDRLAGRSYATEAERQAALAAAQLVDRSSYAKKG